MPRDWRKGGMQRKKVARGGRGRKWQVGKGGGPWMHMQRKKVKRRGPDN